RRLGNNAPCCQLIKQNLKYKSGGKYKDIKEVVEAGTCVRCNEDVTDDKYHAAQCSASIPFLVEQDRKIRGVMKKYPTARKIKKGWITANDARKCSRQQFPRNSTENWLRRYGEKWRGSMGCFGKTYMD